MPIVKAVRAIPEVTASTKTKCFAFKPYECTLLEKRICDKGRCPFYKTKERFQSEMEKYKQRSEEFVKSKKKK